MSEEKMNTKSSTSSSDSTPFGEKSPTNTSDSKSHRRSQMTRIWEWGVDETLWNPDKTRYAGCLHPSGASKAVGDWLKRNEVMTAEEAKQCERSIAAFREYFGEPILDRSVVEDWIDI